MTQSLDARFKLTSGIISQSATQTDTGTSATVKKVVGTTVFLHPKQAGNGTTLKFVLGGARAAGGNGNFTVALYANGTAICTLTSTANTQAKDWFAEIVCVFTSGAVQKSIGRLAQMDEDASAAYEAGAVDCSGGVTLDVRIGSGNASDSIQAEVAYVEMWDFGDMVTA